MTKSLEKPQFTTHYAQSVAFTVFDVRWIPSSARFAVVGQNASGRGVLQVWALTADGIAPVKSVQFMR